MKFTVKNHGDNPLNLMRKVGYFYLPNKHEEEVSFIRLIERNGYPRFHIYLKVDKKAGEIILNLHLDQKRPVYEGVSAHAGEYEGETIEKEANRIKLILK